MSGRLLIVDDAPENLRILHGLLKAEGYTVLAATRGEVALTAALAPEPPELMLLDVRMPGMDGYEVCRRLKEHSATRDIPVIFISAGADAADKIEGFRCGGVDYVTKPFQAEEVLARVATHLALSRQRREIAALSELKDQLIRTISHDLRNPLTVVLGAAELLLAAPASLPEVEKRELVEGIQRRGEDMLRLVTELLDLSRIEAGLPLRLEAVGLAGLLSDEAARAEVAAGARGLTLEVSAPADDVVVKGDVERLRQVVTNLVGNAIRYTPSGGTIRLTAAAEGDHGALSVADTGVGIPADAVPHIFERFYRVPQHAAMDEAGTGLGLSIVKAIVDQHGGRIVVDSTPGGGSRFTVLLPLATAARR